MSSVVLSKVAAVCKDANNVAALFGFLLLLICARLFVPFVGHSLSFFFSRAEQCCLLFWQMTPFVGSLRTEQKWNLDSFPISSLVES